MTQYSNLPQAEALIHDLSLLRAVRENLQRRGPLEMSHGLTAALSNVVLGKASGAALAAYQAAYATLENQLDGVQKGVNSAINQMEAALADIEL